MGKQGKHSKGAAADFKHRRAKVGKQRLAPANLTNATLKWVNLDLSRTDAAAEGDGSTEEFSIPDLLRSTHNHNAHVRKEALFTVRSHLMGSTTAIERNLASIVGVIAERIADPDESVRDTLFGVMETFAMLVSTSALRPFIPLLSAHISSALSKLSTSIRLDALAYVAVLLKHKPELVPVVSPMVIPAIVRLMEPQLQGLTCQSCIASVVPAVREIGAPSAKTCRSKLSSVEARLACATLLQSLTQEHTLRLYQVPQLAVHDSFLEAVCLPPPSWSCAAVASSRAAPSSLWGVIAECLDAGHFPASEAVASVSADVMPFKLFGEAAKQLLHLWLESSPSEAHCAPVSRLSQLTTVLQCLHSLVEIQKYSCARVESGVGLATLDAFIPSRVYHATALKALAEIPWDAVDVEHIPDCSRLITHCVINNIWSLFPFSSSSMDVSSDKTASITLLNARVCALLVSLLPGAIPLAQGPPSGEDGDDSVKLDTSLRTNVFVNLLPLSASTPALGSVSPPPATERVGKRSRKQFETTTKGYLPGAPQSTDTLSALQQLHSLFQAHVEPISSLESQSRAQRRIANNLAKASQEASRIVASVGKWASSQMHACAESFKGRTSDVSAQATALPIILSFLHKLLHLSQRLHASNCEKLLEAFTAMFCHAPVRSAVKLHCVQFLVKFLYASTHINTNGDRLCHLRTGDEGVPVPAGTIQAWLSVFPKMLWSIGTADLPLSMSCIAILREEARRTTTSSSSAVFLKQIARFFAPLLYSVKAIDAESSRAGIFGPFVEYPPALQVALLDFLSSVGGMTPALKRSLCAVYADSRTSTVVRAAVLNAAMRIAQMDMLQGTPVLATVDSDMLSAYAVEALALVLSLAWRANIDASANLGGNRFSLHFEPPYVPPPTEPSKHAIADWQLEVIKDCTRQVEALLALLPVEEFAAVASDILSISCETLGYAAPSTCPSQQLTFVAVWIACLQTRRPDARDHLRPSTQVSDAILAGLRIFNDHEASSIVVAPAGRTPILHPSLLLLPTYRADTSLFNSGLRALSFGIVAFQPALMVRLADVLIQSLTTTAALPDLEGHANLLISVLRHPSLWRQLTIDNAVVPALVRLHDAISPAALVSRPHSDLSALLSRLYQELHAQATLPVALAGAHPGVQAPLQRN